MFDKNFYPTPTEVAHQMLSGMDLYGKTVLEPSAGKGDLINVIKEYGATVIACEFNPDLALIAQQKADKFLKFDFFEVEAHEVSHCDYIIMNPPFDRAAEHIIHAVDIAPKGCKIIAICNTETIDNPYTTTRKHLVSILNANGTHEYLGDVFSTAERKTSVEVSLLSITKTGSDDTDEFEGFFFSNDEREEFFGVGDGLVKYSYVRDVVGRYIQAVKMFDGFIDTQHKLNEIMKPVGGDFKVQFDVVNKRGNIYDILTHDSFKNTLQKSAWLRLFDHMNMQRFLTNKVIEQLNKKLESQTDLPFTERNIYAMVTMIMGTHASRMKDTMVEVFDWLTDHHHDNRMHVEGWKTNSMYMVNKKFIAPYSHIGVGYNGNPEVRWSTAGEKIDELTKALCLLTGQNYDDFTSLHDFFKPVEVPNNDHDEAVKELSEVIGLSEGKCKLIHGRFKYMKYPVPDKALNSMGFDWNLSREMIDKIIKHYNQKQYSEKYFGTRYEVKPWGKWLDWGFFEIRVYKKGTLHAKFKDQFVWELFNRECAKSKGWRLPTNTGSDVRRKANGVEVFV